ncbi:MAG: filamentous hemagglutinin N-terminal domain-containing protein [Oculatellaceae cyanobacterium bins.114]|nr:filamentous hemagglutinin N-terminal domain-containing protein [Oculatellaceae cyanobacterium bins.114]
MMQRPLQRNLASIALAIATIGVWASFAEGAIAQIRPDNTLGNEHSVVNSNVVTERGLIEQIDGGAIRNNALFHSFLDFNVGSQQRVYFSNPRSIENIISRITGNTRSDINGTLGVLGSANLFLINPNGIVFGPNAQLDVRGAFVASTASSLSLGNGLEFSATDPQVPPLVVVNIQPGLQYGAIPTGSAIANQGNLQAGGDVTLAADRLNLSGQVRAGNDLTLFAADQITARDSATTAFVASAGHQLLVQGNQQIDITALSHPGSGLFSGGDMTLRSNGTVIGDTHFTAGGNFTTQRLDGSLGTLQSIQDPVFEVAGNFSLDSYTGASLQILAGGSVSIPGEITITSAGGPFNDSTVVLSNGTSVAVNGTTQPTLDIRAGTTQFFGTPQAGSTPTRANIAIGSIVNPGGLVLLTNQFAPNADLAGNISVGQINTSSLAGGGSVVIDSRGTVTAELIDTSGGDSSTFDIAGDAGNVTLLGDRDIVLPYPSFIFAYGLRGGSITLSSDTAIVQADATFGTPAGQLSFIESGSLGSETGGDVRFTAPRISIGGNVLSSSYGEATGGNLIIQTDSLSTNQSTLATVAFASGDAGRFVVNAEAIALDYSFLGSFAQPDSTGRGGAVEIQTDTLSAVRGAQLGSLALGAGDAGNVNVTAQTISLRGFQPGNLSGGVFAPASIFSASFSATGANSGNVTINTDTLSLQQSAAVSTSAFGVGNAGNVTINATDSVLVDGTVFTAFDNLTHQSLITSEVFTGAVGNAGTVAINTPVLSVTDGGSVSTSTDGSGNAGNVIINATESVLVDGAALFTNPSLTDRISQIAVFVGENSSGQGGTLTLTTPSLTVSNGARLTAVTQGAGNAGNIALNISDVLEIEGNNSGILASTTATATGNSGSITIRNPNQVGIRDRAQIAVDSQGSGTGGDITIQADSLVLDDRGLLTAETASNTGGNIVLQIGDVVVMRRGSRISTTAGTARTGGNGGNIVIDTPFLVAVPSENNDITANAFTGQGGRVSITTQGIFGLVPRSRTELAALLGTSDPTQLDPANLGTSDITAISQVNPDLSGEVIIQTPDTDPLRGVTNLPSDIVDASRLIAQGCSADGAIAGSQGSLVVTGRGGLPPSPTEQLRTDAYVVGWETVTPSSQSTPLSANISDLSPAQRPQRPNQITEAQAFGRDADGKMSLVAQAPSGVIQDFNHSSALCSPTTLPSP